MNILSAHIEAILFVASRPLKVGALAKAVDASPEAVREVIEDLRLRFNQKGSGLFIFFDNDEVQMGTNPEESSFIEGFVRDDVGGELTKAQLETLTVICYRGPVTRPELEEIRGVNCSIILRNLQMRGLVEEETLDGQMLPSYRVSLDALRHLGISSAAELPGFEELHAHAHIEQKLMEGEAV